MPTAPAFLNAVRRTTIQVGRICFDVFLVWRVLAVRPYGKLLRKCGEEMMLRAVSVLPPLAITLLDAINWRGPPMWVGFTDA